MLVKLICLDRRTSGDYFLNEILLNPKHIVMVKGEQTLKKRLQEGNLGIALHPEVEFTKIVIAEGSHNKEIVVVGSPSEVESKIFRKSKQILRG